MKKTVLFVILQQFADWESAYISSAIKMLGNDKFDIKTVSVGKEPVQSIGGFSVLPDYGFDSIPKDYSALILTGGLSWRTNAAHAVKPLVDDCLCRGSLLGGICDASAFLGTVGALNDVNHTANDLDDLIQWAGERYTGKNKFVHKQAVRDKNIITANGTATLEFAKEILIALNVASDKAISEWYEFHKLGVYTFGVPKM